MKQSINICLCIMLAFSLSLNLSAQSSGKKLDQVELAKQWLGTFDMQVGEDSIMHMKALPLGDGLYFLGEWRTAGKTYYSACGVVGFTRDKETIILSGAWSDGGTMQEIGRFVSEKKLVMERFLPDNPNHAVGIGEYDFSDPDKIIWRWFGRGAAVTWDPVWKYEAAYVRVDE